MNNPSRNIESLQFVWLILLSMVLVGGLLILQSEARNEIPSLPASGSNLIIKSGSYEQVAEMEFGVTSLPDSQERDIALQTISSAVEDDVITFSEFGKIQSTHDDAMRKQTNKSGQ